MAENFNELAFNVSTLQYVGISIRRVRLKDAFYKTVRVVVALQYIVHYALFLGRFQTTKHKTVFLSYSMTTMITLIVMQTIFRQIFFAYNKKGIEELISMVEEMPHADSLPFKSMESSMRQRASKYIGRYSKIIVGSYLLSSVIGVAGFLLTRTLYIMVSHAYSGSHQPLGGDSKPRLPLVYELYWPHGDIFSIPSHTFVVIWQVIAIGIYLLTTGVSEAFACAIILAAARRGEFLAQTAPLALIPTRDNRMTNMFCDWIRYHQHYKNIVRRISTEFGFFMLVTNVFAILTIILYLFYLIRRQILMSLVVVPFLLTACYLQIFISANAGQQVINQNENLSRVVCNLERSAERILQVGPARSSLQVIAASCSQLAEESINSSGIFNVSIPLVTIVVRATATYLLVMLQLYKDTDIFPGAT